MIRRLSQWFAKWWGYPFDSTRPKFPPPPSRPPVDVTGSLLDAMQAFREGYARPPTLWTPRHVDLEVWGAMQGKVPRIKRINQATRRTLTRTDAIKRNLKASR